MLQKLKDFALRVWYSKPVKPVRLYVERVVDSVKALARGEWRAEPVVILGALGSLPAELLPVVNDVAVPWWERVIRAVPLLGAWAVSNFTTPSTPSGSTAPGLTG